MSAPLVADIQDRTRVLFLLQIKRLYLSGARFVANIEDLT